MKFLANNFWPVALNTRRLILAPYKNCFRNSRFGDLWNNKKRSETGITAHIFLDVVQILSWFTIHYASYTCFANFFTLVLASCLHFFINDSFLIYLFPCFEVFNCLVWNICEDRLHCLNKSMSLKGRKKWSTKRWVENYLLVIFWKS